MSEIEYVENSVGEVIEVYRKDGLVWLSRSGIGGRRIGIEDDKVEELYEKMKFVCEDG